ncbi:MAG: hypothetical protein CVU53_00310 [Deltaproteobacteria bacterium HGW-Deltaproteobacteria-11]|nr:MAG: hypothetical protein CVU53_00310 [Deltaproteobacteria bacterium HGW-Deltaproteobacteria-11]
MILPGSGIDRMCKGGGQGVMNPAPGNGIIAYATKAPSWLKLRSNGAGFVLNATFYNFATE